MKETKERIDWVDWVKQWSEMGYSCRYHSSINSIGIKIKKQLIPFILETKWKGKNKWRINVSFTSFIHLLRKQI